MRCCIFRLIPCGTGLAMVYLRQKSERHQAAFKLKKGGQKKMKHQRIWVCLVAFLLIMAWVSPVGYAKSANSIKKAAVNINTATVDELVDLPSIGQKVAERIIQYRQKHGSFKTLEDLKTVRGIGDKVFEKVKPMIRVK